MSDPAKVLIVTTGTRGDVEPFIALALGLQARGHVVRIATHARYAGWLAQFGVEIAPISDRSLDRFKSPDARLLLEQQVGFFRQLAAFRRLRRSSQSLAEEANAQSRQIVQDFVPDLIVHQPRSTAMPHIAEATRTPVVMAVLQPYVIPTRDFAPFLMTKLPLFGRNRLAYWLIDLWLSPVLRRINRFRVDQLGLSRVRRVAHVRFPPGAGVTPVLHAISPSVIPRPEDWPDTAHMTGYWRLPDGAEPFEPPADLVRFLSAGPPPVYVGFGSMKTGNAAALSRLVVEALRRAGVRGVIGAGWAGLEVPEGDDMIRIGEVPHGWLFPRMAAVVHHGGAGTTAQGFHAGVPCVICPFFADQPDWAARSVRLGVGATPVPRRTMTAESLGASIEQAVNDPALAENARHLATALAREDGVAEAVRLIERRLASG